MTFIDKTANQVQSIDPIANVEKAVGKHHSEFDDSEKGLSLMYAMTCNQMKNEYFKNLKDTHFSMKWDEFLDIIKNYGFVEGLAYDFQHSDDCYDGNGQHYVQTYTEHAILYYHSTKGLIIWATSYWNGESVNGGTLYGMLEFPHPIEYKDEVTKHGSYRTLVSTDELKRAHNVLDCSHDALINIDKGIGFSLDVREGLINRLVRIEEEWNFMPVWKHARFLWFLDFMEEKVPGYDYKAISKDKILRATPQVQEILKAYLEKE